MADNDNQDETEQAIPIAPQGPLPPQPAAMPPDAMPIAPVPPGMARAWSTTGGVQSPVQNFITGPRPPTDPRAELYKRQAQSNEALWRQLQPRTANLPLAQAEAAVGAAMRFQGIRQYQQAIQSGIPQAEAYRRAAPMMFWQPHQSNLGQAASFLRAISPPEPKIMDVGGTLYRVDPRGTGATALTTPKPPKPEPPNRFDTEEYASVLRQISEIEKDMAPMPMGTRRADLARRARKLQEQADAIRGRYESPQGARPPGTRTGTGGTGRVRVRHPDGRFGSIPASQADAAKAAGYTLVP